MGQSQARDGNGNVGGDARRVRCLRRGFRECVPGSYGDPWFPEIPQDDFPLVGGIFAGRPMVVAVLRETRGRICHKPFCAIYDVLVFHGGGRAYSGRFNLRPDPFVASVSESVCLP